MTKVEHRIQQISKRVAAVQESVDSLLAEYAEGESAHGLKLEAMKTKINAGRLSKSETDFYNQLSVGLKTENPLSVLIRMFLTERTTDGYRVLGSDRQTWYEIPADVTYCPCPRYSNTGNCPHIEGVRMLTILQYKSHVDVTFGIKGESTL